MDSTPNKASKKEEKSESEELSEIDRLLKWMLEKDERKRASVFDLLMDDVVQEKAREYRIKLPGLKDEKKALEEKKKSETPRKAVEVEHKMDMYSYEIGLFFSCLLLLYCGYCLLSL
jgi:hypothetical protein